MRLIFILICPERRKTINRVGANPYKSVARKEQIYETKVFRGFGPGEGSD